MQNTYRQGGPTPIIMQGSYSFILPPCFHCSQVDVLTSQLIRDHDTSQSKLRLLDQQLRILQKRLTSAQDGLSYLAKTKLPTPSSKPEIPDSPFDLSSSLFSAPLPESLFTVLVNPKQSLSFLFQSGLVSLTKCAFCGNSKMRIAENSRTGRFSYYCGCGLEYPVMRNTLWGSEATDKPQQFLMSLILFMTGVKDIDICRLVGGNDQSVKDMIQLVLNVVSHCYLKNLPKFRGVVEIDESAFRGHRVTRGKNITDKWVFGLYERERKLVYMEIVQTRKASELIPIVRKICESGTTIISDQWAAYNKLEEHGFPHYTVDHSRFFVNPNSREIHTQNIEISWGWAKYEIRRQNRALYYLEKYIHLFCWKRQFKTGDREGDIATMIRAFCGAFKEYEADMRKGEKMNS
jgi:transposase-like protein